MNVILETDSYKLTHYRQYPRGTEGVYSYFESREGAEYPYTVFFGLQPILDKISGAVVDGYDIAEAKKLCDAHLGPGIFNADGWARVAQVHGGRLPVRIRAVPEGLAVPTGNVLMTVENTDPECFWLTDALESLLVHVWYPSTVATRSHRTLARIGDRLDEAGDSRDGLPFMLHDFGYRGAASSEAAALGGAAHLVNSSGTDTLPGLQLAQDCYAADLSETAFSVPATEHSIMTSLGRDGEREVASNVIDAYPTGIVSIVADSYDIYGFVSWVCSPTQVARVKERDGKVVIRPDSVPPGETPASLMEWISRKLWNSYGGSFNRHGLRVLDPHVGVLWGDGISEDGIYEILDHCTGEGYSPSNYVFGMGGGLLQKLNRDTQRFAFKSSAQKRGGEWYDVQKNPLGGKKPSKAGRLALVGEDGAYRTVREGSEEDDVLQTVFEDGEVLVRHKFSEIRERAAQVG